MKRKTFLIGIISVIIIFGVVFMLLSKTLSPNYIAISETNISDKVISIKGSIAESATVFKGYTSSVKDGDLFIKIKGSLITFGNGDNDFEIKINKKEYGNIKKIFLQDRNNTRQIWPKD